MTNVIITLSIWWIAPTKAKATVIGVELENAGILSMTRTNWMVNKAMPDSIMTKITERYFLPPTTP